jgi:ribosomal protein S1
MENKVRTVAANPYNLRGLKTISLGALVNGTVLKKGRGELYIDLKNLGLCRIYGQEYSQSKQLISKLNQGDEVVVKITGFDDGYGNYECSLQNIEEINQWQKIKNFLKNKKIIEAKIIDANKGGLITEIEGIKAFIPVSQLAPEHYPRISNSNKNLILNHLKSFIGQSFQLRLISADPGSQKLILSERLAREEIYKQVLSNYTIGQIVDVQVVGLGSFGIFVRFHENPPLDGLIHLKEIPQEDQDLESKFKVGDRLKAKIVKLEGDRANFSLKDLNEDPWIAFSRSHRIGESVSGRVIQKNDDVFATIEIEGIRGVTFEQLAALTEGEEYIFKIESIEPKEHKLIVNLATTN